MAMKRIRRQCVAALSTSLTSSVGIRAQYFCSPSHTQERLNCRPAKSHIAIFCRLGALSNEHYGLRFQFLLLILQVDVLVTQHPGQAVLNRRRRLISCMFACVAQGFASGHPACKRSAIQHASKVTRHVNNTRTYRPYFETSQALLRTHCYRLYVPALILHGAGSLSAYRTLDRRHRCRPHLTARLIDLPDARRAGTIPKLFRT
jgi:hypothetical protein